MNSLLLLTVTNLLLLVLLLFGETVNCHIEKGQLMRFAVLENEHCYPRKELVNVEVQEMGLYTPMMVAVLRCSGVADGINPILKKCVKNITETIRFPVRDKYNPNFMIYKDIENHLSCKGQCVHDKSVCKGASTWSEKQCKCLCLVQQRCPEHYAWDPNKCQCVCNRSCHRRQELDPEECTCTCKSKFYRRCTKRGRVPNEHDCMCLRGPITLASCSPCKCKK